MKTIILSQNQETIVDDLDFTTLSQHKWCFDNSTGYAVRNVYPLDRRHPKKIYMHRVIANNNDTTKEIVTDHINRDKLDNRRNNLRIVSRRVNLLNSARFGETE